MKKFENPEIEVLIIETEDVAAGDLDVSGKTGLVINTFGWSAD